MILMVPSLQTQENLHVVLSEQVPWPPMCTWAQNACAASLHGV